MGRAQVRAATATWFDPASGSGLGAYGLVKVHRSMPKTVTQAEIMTSPYNARSGAVAFVAVEHTTESRIAFGGPHSGWKRTQHVVLLRVRHSSVAPDAEVAMDDFDALVDAIGARLRTDRTLNSAFIFEAGEDNVLDWTFGEPTTDNGGVTLMWADLRFLAIQMIQS